MAVLGSLADHFVNSSLTAASERKPAIPRPDFGTSRRIVCVHPELSFGQPTIRDFDARLTTNSRPSSEKMDKQFYKLLERQEPEKQTLVIDLK